MSVGRQAYVNWQREVQNRLSAPIDILATDPLETPVHHQLLAGENDDQIVLQSASIASTRRLKPHCKERNNGGL